MSIQFQVDGNKFSEFFSIMTKGTYDTIESYYKSRDEGLIPDAFLEKSKLVDLLLDQVSEEPENESIKRKLLKINANNQIHKYAVEILGSGDEPGPTDINPHWDEFHNVASGLKLERPLCAYLDQVILKPPFHYLDADICVDSDNGYTSSWYLSFARTMTQKDKDRVFSQALKGLAENYPNVAIDASTQCAHIKIRSDHYTAVLDNAQDGLGLYLGRAGVAKFNTHTISDYWQLSTAQFNMVNTLISSVYPKDAPQQTVYLRFERDPLMDLDYDDD